MPPSSHAHGLPIDARGRHALGQFIGEDAQLRSQLALLPRLAKSEVTVLVAGETGTGKELAARALHYLSPRAGAPFVPVNCGALPADLVENELFGHVAGAYTGALRDADGLIREADGGTLFLDEVDSLPAGSQVKLLRFLQEKEFRPVGARKSRQADVRVVAATSANLAEDMRAGRFRADLYYRLNVVTIRLPPLRDRRGDILHLARHFLRKHATRNGLAVPPELTPAATQKLLGYAWPGNVRELENVIQRAVVLAEDECLDARHITLDGESTAAPTPTAKFHQLKREVVNAFEQRYLTDILRAHNGNITHAARAAGKHRRAFWELMRKHGLQARDSAGK
jgi:two-component system response regulator GlrR